MAHLDTSYRVTLADTGETYSCPSSENTLTALAKTGRKGIPVGCRGGGCGICKVAVMEGSYAKRVMSRSHISEEDEAAHVVLACCIQPTTDLKIKVVGKLQKAIHR